MPAARLLLLLLLILVAVVIVVVVLRRGAAQRDAHRVQAAHLRSDAETLAADVAGQSAFADQATERAEVARVEAEERAREAARLEAEAAEHRAALEATQRDYEATMRRADDIDPDVKESRYPAVSESEGERAVGGAAAGASAWAARGDVDPNGGHDGRDERDSGGESERIASAADFRDDVDAEPTEVYPAPGRGSQPDMSDDASTETQQHPGNDDGLDAAGAAAAASAGGEGGAYAATRAMHDEDGGNEAGAGATGDDTTHGTDRADADAVDRVDADRDGADRTDADGTDADSTDADRTAAEAGSHDVDSERGDGAGRAEGDSAEITMIAETEGYATTEPVMASEQAPPVSPEGADTDARGDAAPGEGDADTSRKDRRTGAAPSDDAAAEGDGSDRSAADLAEEPRQERYDPTPSRDWASDEGEMLEESSSRGDRLEADRADLAEEAGDVTSSTASDDSRDTASGDSGATASAGRRISAFEEIRDGGFGVGSAAPLEGGAQPLDHPVQGYHDMTYRAPGDAGYDAGEPDVWFYDEGAAERSGFRRADG